MILELENGTKVEPINILQYASSKKLIDHLSKTFEQMTGCKIWVGIEQRFSNFTMNENPEITILPCRIVDSKMSNKPENVQE